VQPDPEFVAKAERSMARQVIGGLGHPARKQLHRGGRPDSSWRQSAPGDAKQKAARGGFRSTNYLDFCFCFYCCIHCCLLLLLFEPVFERLFKNRC